MTNYTSLIQLAQRILTESAGSPLKLKNPVKLKSPNLVLRCQLDPPLPNVSPSVVIKQVTTTEFNNPDGPANESHRYLNEWASLEFLSNLSGKNYYGPRLLASNRDGNLIVLEDLGEHQSVQDLLFANNRATAEKGMVAMGSFLGQLQTAAYGRGDEFSAIQSSLRAVSPLSDSTMDFRERSEDFQDCLEILQITPATGFWEALDNLEQSIHSPSPFYTFIHGDAGPHNFLYIDDSVQLLDYEFGTFHNGLLDVVSARLGFPHTAKVQSVPLETARQLERAYQREIAHVVPEATDDALFEQAMVDACAHWALSRWIGNWTYYFKERFEIGEAMMNKKMGISLEEAQARRSRPLTLYQSFIQFAQISNRQLPIAETLQSYIRILQQEWPELEVMPIYPALRDSNT